MFYNKIFVLAVYYFAAVNSLIFENNNSSSLNIKYHVSSDEQNWFQALIRCHNAGMELASIRSKTDYDNLDKYLKENGFKGGYWLSATNLGNGNYYWASSGSAVIYSNWLPNQPDNAKLAENKYKGENCIQWGIYNSNPEPSGWNDMHCNYKIRYICQETDVCE
ncbi:perlucin-like protein [Sitophilus oryzae]|uniref:Perlucin-like protein n=1 Tax=Sitophilus oryzae TaxID=7048 RepID=A0A6J2YB29_SITOR|nr:perlucin-like protein [Sitophilus oryzae]